MKLAVVIVNYNTLGDTLDCLTSLKQAKPPKGMTLQTIVVDNASTDGIEDVLPEKYPEVTFIQNRKNTGIAGGINVGISRAGQDTTHFLFLNNDTEVPPTFFKDIKDSAIKDKDVGLLTPLIYFAKGYEFKKRYKKNELGKVVWSAGGTIDWNNILGSNTHVDEVDNGQFKEVIDTDFVTGAAALVKKEVIDKVGLINEKYFMYLEDMEFSQRVKNAGWRIVFDPSIKLWHKVAQSSGVGSSLNDYFITRNRLLFGMRYAKLRTKIALVREAFRKLSSGTPAQKTAIKDFFTGNLGKGSWKN